MNTLLADLMISFPHNGSFNLKIGHKITQATIDYNVPNGYGIYLIYEGFDCLGELIYIGHAGTINAKGDFKAQGLKKRFGAKQNGKGRNEYFKEYMEKTKKGLSFAWFVTFDGVKLKVLPSFAEARELQKYYDSNHKLPKLNRIF